MTSNETPPKEVTIVLGTLKDIAEAVVHGAQPATYSPTLSMTFSTYADDQ